MNPKTSITTSLPWVVLHLPHDSTEVPKHVRNQFSVSDSELERELLLMTDHHTGDLFSMPGFTSLTIRSPVSRLVLDVERFHDDSLEVMSSRGMGAVYSRTAHGRALRREITDTERQTLLDDYYWPHHLHLEQAAEQALRDHGQALILDAHSFPSQPLPYELDQNPDRPDICIGTDSFHTPEALRDDFIDAFEVAGFSVRLNEPFSGSLVPSQYFQRESRVWSIMVEVNRGIYMDEATGRPLELFPIIAQRIRNCCLHAILGIKSTP
jgi:N-formylglutamate deformylase